MKAIKTTLIICLLLTISTIKSQNAEQYISNVVNEINYKIEEVHQLASQKRMYECIKKLDEVYFKLSSERRKGTFDEEYKKAKRNNPSFTYKIRQDLPKQLEATYWKNKLAQCERILANQDVVIQGMIAAKRFNNEDKFIALVKQLKTGYDAISGIIENTATFNPLKLAYDLHGNFNDAIDNYKAYEAADLKNLEIDEKMAKFNLTISKAKKNKLNFGFFKTYLKDNYDAVTTFKANVEYLNRIKNSIDSGPIDKLDFTSLKYNWNYGPFQKEVEELCRYFNPTNDYCADFRKEYNEINTQAKHSLRKVIKNIEASDDQGNKQRFINENNDRWTEYLGVVDPKFAKVYNKHCGASKEQNTGGEAISNKTENQGTGSFERTTNDRILNIQSLSIENSYGVLTNVFSPGQQAKVKFRAKWDGKWLERVQLKILIDNEVVLNEIHAFRNNMGDFLTDFSKTILIPKHLGDGEYRLSLYISRDPKALNKSLQVKCTPKTIQIDIADTRNQTTTEDKEEVTQNTNEAVPDYNNLFAGSKVKKKAAVAKTSPKKKTSVAKTSSNTKSVDKYWEIRIPEDDVQKEWMINKRGEYEVRYRVNGRTVGFRAFDDPDFLIPVWEMVMNNITIKHGLYREFKERKDGSIYVSEIQFYKENKNVGPRYESYGNGPMDNWNYMLEKYKTQLQKDPSIHPIDIYEDEYVLEYIPSEPELSVKYMFGDMNVSSVSNFQLPSNPIKIIVVENDKFLYEKLYSSKPTHHAIGQRNIADYSSKNPRISRYQIRRGHVTFNASWFQGNCHASFWYAPKYYKGSYGKEVGPEAGNSASIEFNMPDGKSILSYNRKLYEKEYANNNKLPKPDLLDNFNITRPQYFSYPDPSWASSNPLNIDIGNSQLWRGELYYNSSKTFRFYYVSNNNISAINRWVDGKHKECLAFKDLRKIYEIRWFSNAKPKYLQAKGHLLNGIRFEWNEDGSFKPDRHPTTGKFTLKYLKKYENIPDAPSLDVLSSSRMKPDQNLPSIPQSEVTPMFKRIWGKDNIEIATPSYELVSEQNQFDNTEMDDLNTADDIDKDEQSLINQEFSKLTDEIGKITEQADQSFNKKYWNDPNSTRVTMNEINPKQEALDILRRVIPIVDRAKYPGPKLLAYHMLSMKFTEYSGRVFGYVAKQAFFTEAAKMINKADNLMPQLRSMGKQALSGFYCASAEVWRGMTRKAQWGDHAYNKMACDKKVIQQYERAVQTDPNNQKARRILENLKAPKKAIPAAVEQFEEIPDETWNKAQQEMLRMDEEKMNEEIFKEPEINALEVAEMTLEVVEGTVSIKRSGAANWELVTDSHILLFNRDKIKTSENARGVSITYTSDNAFLAIKNSAEVEIVDEHSLMIRRGGSLIQVNKKGSKFLVYTPTYAVGVRGTEFEVKVADDKSTETFLYEGVVETRNANDIGYLVPGQKMSAKKGDLKLQQSEFNAAQRKASNWSNLDQLKRKHQQIIANNPISKQGGFAAKKGGVFSNTKDKKNPFAGASSGNTNKPKAKPKTYDSQPKYDEIPDRNVNKPRIQNIVISASPDKQYHAVLVSRNLDYEYTALVARCPVNVNTRTALTVNWYYNNQPQPISVGNYEVLPQASQYDATVFSYDGPLNPGTYKAEFIMNSYLIGRGTVTIKSQERYGEQEAQQYYVEAVKGMELAIQLLNAGDYTNAGDMARSTLPVLQSVLYNAPNLPDVLSVMQTTQTIISMDKVNTLLQQSNSRKALEWAQVSLGTINSAYQNSQDPQFKQTLGGLKRVVEEIVFELKKL